MVFTDDDLKRLKLRLSADYFVRNKFVDAQDVEALLARLEAAEKLVYLIGPCHRCVACYREEERAWHKAAGK